MKTTGQIKQSSVLLTGMMFFGIVAGVWSFAALMMGLSSVGWQVSELGRNYMVSLGMIGEQQTLVDFYTHIKGIEYIIAVAFIGAFPVFFKAVNKSGSPAAKIENI